MYSSPSLTQAKPFSFVDQVPPLMLYVRSYPPFIETKVKIIVNLLLTILFNNLRTQPNIMCLSHRETKFFYDLVCKTVTSHSVISNPTIFFKAPMDNQKQGEARDSTAPYCGTPAQDCQKKKKKLLTDHLL